MIELSNEKKKKNFAADQGKSNGFNKREIAADNGMRVILPRHLE